MTLGLEVKDLVVCFDLLFHIYFHLTMSTPSHDLRLSFEQGSVSIVQKQIEELGMQTLTGRERKARILPMT